jgi:cytochrome c-type biogenesis protein CcmH
VTDVRDARLWVSWALLAVVLAGALAVAASDDGAPMTASERSYSLARQIRCPQCDGQSVAESDVVVSREIRRDIAARVTQGQSDAEILDAYVQSYGRDVLLEPPTSGVSVVVWWLPALVAVAAVGGLVRVLRRAPTEPADGGGPAAGSAGRDPGRVGDRLPSADTSVTSVTSSTDPVGAAATGSARSRFATAAVILAVLAGVVGVLAVQGADERGESATGGARQSSDQLLGSARQELADGDMAGAFATYGEVLELAPQNVEALAYRGWVGSRNGELTGSEALELVDEALAVSSTSVDAQVFRMVLLAEAERTDDAVAVLVGLDPERLPEGMAPLVAGFGVDLAIARAESGDVVGANEVIDAVLVVAPDDLGALVYKGTLLGSIAQRATGDDRALLEGRALDALDRAVELAAEGGGSQLPAALVARAGVLIDLGRPDDAADDLGTLDGLEVPDELVEQVDALRVELGER